MRRRCGVQRFMVYVQRLVKRGNSALSQAVFFGVCLDVWGVECFGSDWMSRRWLLDLSRCFLCLVRLAGLSPRQATYFLCFAKESRQRKATRLAGALRFASGNLCCPGKAGVELELASLRQSLALIPLFPVSTGPARTGWAGCGDMGGNPARARVRKRALGRFAFGWLRRLRPVPRLASVWPGCAARRANQARARRCG